MFADVYNSIDYSLGQLGFFFFVVLDFFFYCFSEVCCFENAFCLTLLCLEIPLQYISSYDLMIETVFIL